MSVIPELTIQTESVNKRINNTNDVERKPLAPSHYPLATPEIMSSNELTGFLNF